MEQATKQKLITDVNAVLVDAEELLRQAAAESGEKATELRRKAQTAITNAKARLVDIEHKVEAQARSAAKATDGWVHEHPWTAVGIAAGIGLLLGLSINRH